MTDKSKLYIGLGDYEAAIYIITRNVTECLEWFKWIDDNRNPRVFVEVYNSDTLEKLGYLKRDGDIGEKPYEAQIEQNE